jgi:hypothetical protein
MTQETRASASFRSLDSAKVVETITKLHGRISAQFRGAGLADVCAELAVIARENSGRARQVAAANIPLRVAIYSILAVGAAGLLWVGWLVLGLPAEGGFFSVLQGVEAAANLIVLIGAPAYFLTRTEERLKRRQALTSLHELRSIVHVIDMHQLTKDPSAMIIGGEAPGRPAQQLTPYQVARYLDYCSEMLSLTAKVAVLFAQGFPDPVVVDAVSDIERLVTGLSQKIWQKIMILEAEGHDRPGAGAADRARG